MLLTTIDLGSSLTKGFYLDGGLPHPLTMEPEVAWVQPEMIGKYQTINREAQAEKVAWVELDSDVAAVGQFAQSFSGDAGLIERKERRAIYKVLGMLGVIRERLQLPSSFSADLAIMLPITEFSDRKKLSAAIQQAAHKFAFRGQPLSVSFPKLQILPEGFGLFLTRRGELMSQGINARNRTIVVLMFGHRNLSILVFQDGVLQGSSRSDGPGFLNAVEIAASLQGLPTAAPNLAETIALGLPQLRIAGQLKPVDMETANVVAREGYSQQVRRYLENYLPGGEYDVIVAGGAAAVIQPELTELFDLMGLTSRISFGESLRHQLESLLRQYPELQSQSALSLRMTDAYAVFGATWVMQQHTIAA